MATFQSRRSPAALGSSNLRYHVALNDYVRLLLVLLNLNGQDLKRCVGDAVYYGGRGIAVCEAWRRSFWVFLGDVGLRPSVPGFRFSIDRMITTGTMSRTTRWATESEQNFNRRQVALQ